MGKLLCVAVSMCARRRPTTGLIGRLSLARGGIPSRTRRTIPTSIQDDSWPVSTLTNKPSHVARLSGRHETVPLNWRRTRVEDIRLVDGP